MRADRALALSPMADSFKSIEFEGFIAVDAKAFRLFGPNGHGV
jgi:hypothetical protein